MHVDPGAPFLADFARSGVVDFCARTFRSSDYFFGWLRSAMVPFVTIK
jgi:hypothetical protein